MVLQITVLYLNLKSVNTRRVFNCCKEFNLLKKINLKMLKDTLPVGDDELNERVRLCCKLI